MFGVGRESRICSTSYTADRLADEKTQLRPSYLRRKVASFCKFLSRNPEVIVA